MNEATIKIEEIRKATLNGKQVKLFKAYKLEDGAYIFIGQFWAPVRTANKDLAQHINN